MVSHVVLFKPRPNLSAGERAALLASFEHAIQAIPTVRGVRVGRRIVHGASYEQRSPEIADFLVMIDFDDMAGLRRYLEHDAHQELGTLFNQSLASALVYDFELTALADLNEIG